jgi:predicted enzyme related to lactoylglutathione lyase
MNPVIHFEMPAEDRKRMADFYTQVFGWRAQMLGPEMGNYVVVTTSEVARRNPATSTVAFSKNQTTNRTNIPRSSSQ